MSATTTKMLSSG